MNLSDDYIFHIPGNLTQQSFCSIVHICCTHDHLFFSVEHLPAREPIFYFLPAIPFRAGLCKALRKNTASEARMIFAETRKGSALLNPDGTGRTLQAEIKERSVGYYSLSSSSCGIRCCKSGSFLIRSISSSIICITSALMRE